MTLNKKVLIIVGFASLFVAGILYAITSKIVLGSFVKLEEQNVRTNVKRVHNALQDKLAELDATAGDWAPWNETRDFVLDGNKEYIDNNLLSVTLINLKLNFMIFINSSGQLVHAKGVDLIDQKNKPVSKTLIEHLLSNKFLLQHANPTDSKLGIILLPESPVLMTAWPISNNEVKGPVHGTLVVGRYLDDKEIQNLMEKTELSISFTRADTSKLPSDFETASSSFSADSPVVIKELNTETIAGYTKLNDIYGNPGLFLRVEMPRDILKNGRYSNHSFFWVLLSVGVIVLIVLLFTLQTTVLGPLRKLKNHILSVGENGDLSVRLSLKRKDEIGILAGEFDKMLVKLEKRSSDLEELNKKMQEDIQKRRRAEKALRESEERYRAVVKQASEGIFLIDTDTKTILETNRSFQDMLGYKPDEMLRLNIYDVVAHDRSDVDANIKKIISQKYYFVGERKYRHKDGTILDFEASSNLISFGGKDVLCVVVRDITEFKKIEEDKAKLEVQLQRAQKMEAIGTLAGGVAHDLNNIFSGLVSYPELLLMDLPQDSPLKKPLLTIKKSGEKAATIVQDLLTLARRGIAVTEVVSLNQVISEYLKSPESEKLQTFHPEVKIETSLEAKLLNVFGSPVHLTKTVMNLVSNAAESMINGGKVIITTKNQYIDHPIKGYDEVEEGDYVVLRVIDNGIGISAKDMERIFEPFYSKKVMGRSGTGLGMAVVWGTVKDHKGYIDVQSTDGKGTIFTLYFPITRMEISKDESSLSIEDYMGSGELILVVDDVEEQREIASEMLRKLGYSVESAASGEEAVEYMENNTTDLIILDMIMEPGINGRETYENIVKYHPNQKAIIASGFSKTDDVKKAQELGAGKYIKKPYILEKIGLAVRDELARNRHLKT